MGCVLGDWQHQWLSVNKIELHFDMNFVQHLKQLVAIKVRVYFVTLIPSQCTSSNNCVNVMGGLVKDIGQDSGAHQYQIYASNQSISLVRIVRRTETFMDYLPGNSEGYPSMYCGGHFQWSLPLGTKTMDLCLKSSATCTVHCRSISQMMLVSFINL